MKKYIDVPKYINIALTYAIEKLGANVYMILLDKIKDTILMDKIINKFRIYFKAELNCALETMINNHCVWDRKSELLILDPATIAEEMLIYIPSYLIPDYTQKLLCFTFNNIQYEEFVIIQDKRKHNYINNNIEININEDIKYEKIKVIIICTIEFVSNLLNYEYIDIFFQDPNINLETEYVKHFKSMFDNCFNFIRNNKSIFKPKIDTIITRSKKK